jgi:uncharacterized membrane protein YebE (DUF533 family)
MNDELKLRAEVEDLLDSHPFGMNFTRRVDAIMALIAAARADGRDTRSERAVHESTDFGESC